jgi:hypothetical protein
MSIDDTIAATATAEQVLGHLLAGPSREVRKPSGGRHSPWQSHTWRDFGSSPAAAITPMT